MAGLYYLMLSLSLILLLFAMLGKECQIKCSGNIISLSSRLLIIDIQSMSKDIWAKERQIKNMVANCPDSDRSYQKKRGNPSTTF